jgi:four helix bundle protein
MQTHKDLILWQKSVDFVVEVYKLTNSFPKEEIYGLTSQIRRSAVSISSNIAEGYGRHSDKELVRFLFISLGSASEIETQLLISQRLNFLDNESFEKLNRDILEIIRMLSALIKSKNQGGLIHPDNFE